jgi:hypothetical protein
MKMPVLYRCVAAIVPLLLGGLSASGQYIPSPAVLNTAATTAGNFYNETSITLSPGFIATATSANSYSYFIQGSAPVAGCPLLALAPSGDRNYILTSVPRKEGFIPGASGQTPCAVMQTIQYFDGLGRPMQTVQVKGSPGYRDIVQPVVYDQYGREVQKYLPYTATAAVSDGSYKANAVADQASFYNEPSGTAWNAPGVVTIPAVNGITPSYAQTVFEASPLNRVLEQGGPGAVWQPVSGSTAGHTVKMEYTSNNLIPMTGTDAANSRMAALYTISAIDAVDQKRTLSRSGYYGAGQLYVTVSKDENWVSGRAGTMEEYKDKEGHVVLKRTFNVQTGGALEVLSTYYVYDDLGNLAYVLPPKSNADEAQPVDAALNALCYQYRYDERNRLTQKRVPGKEWEEIIYNKLDQVVFTRDGEQRKRNERSFNKYDGLGRVIISGVESGHTMSRAQVQQIVNDQTGRLWEVPDAAGFQGYTTTCSPGNLNTMKALVVNYYGNTAAPERPAAYTAPANASSRTTGLLTASKVNVLGTTAMLWSINYYDDEGRNVKTYKQHYLNAANHVNNYDEISTDYDFLDQVLTTTRNHYANGVTGALMVKNRYEYDHMGRKLSSYQQTGNTGSPEVLIAATGYNEIGQLKLKQLHRESTGSSFLQETSYAYNERGWLTRLNNPLDAPTALKMFSMELKYNDGTFPQYNGNIAGQVWYPLNQPVQTYAYKYDALNRLTEGTSSGATVNMSEKDIKYDKMGNITSLTRDNTAHGYTYITTDGIEGNQLKTVGGYTTSEYIYDDNGNMKTDGRKGVGLTYNLLNLPQAVSKTGLSMSYTYDASGQKLRKVSSQTGTNDYISGIQYATINSAYVVDFVPTEEGRAKRKSDGTYYYEYDLTDHLGNVRMTFQKGAAGTAERTQADDYYGIGRK